MDVVLLSFTNRDLNLCQFCFLQYSLTLACMLYLNVLKSLAGIGENTSGCEHLLGFLFNLIVVLFSHSLKQLLFFLKFF